MPLTPQEVASKVFGPTRMRRGYDENEVDAFLDQVEAELTRLNTENEKLRQELEQARRGQFAGDDRAPAAEAEVQPAPAAAASAPASEADAILPLTKPAAPAQPAAPAPAAAPDDAAVEQRVARMLVLAQQTADAAVRDAQSEAERLLAAARARAADEVNALERNKTTLENEVEQLQEFEREYRHRLRAYLEMQLRELDAGGDGPAAVEGRGAAALGAIPLATDEPSTPHEPANADDETPPADSERDPLSSGLSDPPGFGPVWSPGLVDHSAGDPLVGGHREREGQAGSSPFDTGEGDRTSGFGSGL